jgi:hypothetical protein
VHAAKQEGCSLERSSSTAHLLFDRPNLRDQHLVMGDDSALNELILANEFITSPLLGSDPFCSTERGHALNYSPSRTKEAHFHTIVSQNPVVRVQSFLDVVDTFVGLDRTPTTVGIPVNLARSRLTRGLKCPSV